MEPREKDYYLKNVEAISRKQVVVIDNKAIVERAASDGYLAIESASKNGFDWTKLKPVEIQKQVKTLISTSTNSLTVRHRSPLEKTMSY